MSEEIVNPTRNRGGTDYISTMGRYNKIPIFVVYLYTEEDKGIVSVALTSKLYLDKILKFIDDTVRSKSIDSLDIVLEEALLSFQVIYFSLLRLLRRTIQALDNNFEITLASIVEDIKRRFGYKEEHTYIG